MRALRSIFAIVIVLALIILAMWLWGDFTKAKCLNSQNERRWSIVGCEEYSPQREWILIDPIFYNPPQYNEATKNRPEASNKERNCDN
jgi:hypothetical protein